MTRAVATKDGQWLRRATQRLAAFGRQEDGAATIEAIIITPVVLVFLAGILEFGAFMYNKIELETGLRDAARYIARCRDEVDPIAGQTFGCDLATAQNLAIYGTPNPTTGASPRVTGWAPSFDPSDPPLDESGEPTIVDVSVDDVPNDVDDETGQSDYRGGEFIYIVRVSTEIDYPGGTLLGLVGIASIPMAAYHEERYIGW